MTGQERASLQLASRRLCVLQRARCGVGGLEGPGLQEKKTGKPLCQGNTLPAEGWKAESARAQPAATDNFRRPATDRYQQPVLATH